MTERPAEAGTPNEWPTLPEHVKKFRLGIYCADYEQPISLMRVLGPFATMAKEDPRLELVFPPVVLDTRDDKLQLAKRLSWNWLIQCDAVFFLHPESEVHVHSASLAWQLGVPIWSELVDDVFNVDADNPGILSRSNKRQLVENIRAVARWSAVVTCVSECNRQAIIDALKAESGKRESEKSQRDGPSENENKFLVIPEGVMWPARNEARKKVVSWRGLGSHGQDVGEALPHLVEAAKAFPDWTWLFGGDQTILQEVGQALAQVIDRDKILLMPYWPTPFEAMQAWGGQCPFLHVVPLADTPFNRSKSHLAWLEASAVGAATIVPDHLPEWDQAGVIKYRHSNLEVRSSECGVRNGGGSATGQIRPTLSEVLKREMARYRPPEGGTPNFHPNVRVSREAIMPERTLWAMNRRRWSILRKLAELATDGTRIKHGGEET